MKRYTLLYIVAALLAAFVTQPAHAQQTEQDALYIFRNDGGFNAFFFDDIDHFEYSCIDTLGIEHDDYVVQEVYAMDSIFRIPLSAIDSIAFVTPEPIYKKDVIMIDKGITDYITASDTVNWIRLDNSTPENLIPKKGDKILLNYSSNLIPEGFGGRVTSVEKTSIGTIVTTEALQPEEAFERAVFKMSASSEPTQKTRGENTLFGSEEPIVIGPFQGEASLTGSKDLINVIDLFSFSVSPLGSIRYNIKPTVELRSFFCVDDNNAINIDSYVKLDADVDLYAKVQGTITTRLDAPFKFPGSFIRVVLGKKDQPFYFKGLLKMGLFMQADSEVKLELGTTGQLNTYASIGYYKPLLGFGHWTNDANASYFPPNINYKFSNHKGDYKSGLFFEAQLEFNNPLTKKGQINFGHRSEFAIQLGVDGDHIDFSDDLMETIWKDEAYPKLDRDDIFTADLYASWDLYASVFDWQFSLDKPSVNLFHDFAGLVPAIYRHKLEVDEEEAPYYGNASYQMTRHLAVPVQVGFAMYDLEDNLVDTWWREDWYRSFGDNAEVKHTFTFDPVLNNTKEYYIYPMVSVLGYPILEPHWNEWKMQPAYIDVPEKVEVSDKQEQTEVDIPTNIPVVAPFSSADWLEFYWWDFGRTLIIKHKELPDEMDSRQAIVYIDAKNSKGETLIEREFTVIQKASEDRIKFTVSPTPIEVPGYSNEFQNGKITKQITVTYPKSAIGLRLSSSDESWLRADNGGGIGSGSNTCNVTIDGNTSMKNPRKGTITVELTKADGTTVTKTVEVKQSALELKVEPKPGEVTLEAQEDEESKYSDKKIVKIEITPYDNFIASLIKDQEVTPNAEWIIPSISGSTIEIYAEANPVEEDRENTVTYKLTLTTGDVIERTIKVLQLALAGDPNIIDAGDLHFPAKGGDQTFTIDVPNVDRITDVTAYSGWIGVAGSGLKVTVLVKENDRPEARDGIFRVDVIMKDGKEGVLYYKVTQDAGVGFGEISSIDLSLKVAENTIYDDGDTYSGTYDRDATVSTDKGEITTSPYGKNGLHVVCSQTIDYWHLYNYTVTFDIDDIYGISSKTAKILNLSFHLTEDDKSDSSTTHGEEGIKISSIPMNGENQWGGTAGGGIVFSNFVDKYSSVTYNDDGEVVYSSSKRATLVDDPSNVVRIKLHFR